MNAAIVSTGFGSPAREQFDHAPARTRLRMTRRGRIVLTALVATPLIVWALVVVLGSGGAAAEGGSGLGGVEVGGIGLTTVTIHDGDSLWAIAESIAPRSDPRVVIDEILRLNGLDDAVVEPGQRLALPVLP